MKKYMHKHWPREFSLHSYDIILVYALDDDRYSYNSKIYFAKIVSHVPESGTLFVMLVILATE